jgi:hypothetical protein
MLVAQGTVRIARGPLVAVAELVLPAATVLALLAEQVA